MKVLAIGCLILLCVAVTSADLYLHNPRGSNNRLNGSGTNRANNNRLCDTQNNAKGGYCWGPKMYYYVGSLLSVEWTNQHGCGAGHDKVTCNIVLQYMCGNIRDGNTTQTPPDNENQVNRVEPNGALTYGMHEDYYYYQRCKVRQRNRGLFTADQNMNGRNAARNTRQNRNGNRSGFECPEERDYYPYWHPTPWKDIAVLVDDTSRCDYYRRESQNVMPKGNCTEPQYNNRAECDQNGGSWDEVPAWGIAAPDCQAAPWSRHNHLGNGIDGYSNVYNWTIPNDPNENCVLRVRYNISTEDGPTPFWDLDSASNLESSPVTQDPYVMHMGKELRLAIDTDQFGRTFQDRSHTFEIRARGAGIDPTRRIHNLNVRGKRGNIVEAYPAVEYDFVPNRLKVALGDYIHFQWTGCDTNPQGNDGEGRTRTDRNNIVPVTDLRDSVFQDYQGEGVPALLSAEQADMAAHLGQTNCLSKDALNAKHNNNQGNVDQDIQNCAKLNAAPTPYHDVGLVQVGVTGNYKYICSRNNNFTNRGQKAVIISNPLVSTFGIVLLVVASAGFVAAIAIALVVKFAPGSALAGAAVG